MKSIVKHLLVILIALGSNAALAGSIEITAPQDGARVPIGQEFDVAYKIVPNEGGDHAHIYVDKKEIAVLRKLQASYTLDGLSKGSHVVCVKVVNAAHVSIGQEKCITIIAE